MIMAVKQTQIPDKTIENLLSEANEEVLTKKRGEKILVELPVIDLEKLSVMSKEQLVILVERMACQCGLVAIMTDEQTAQAMLDTLAQTALKPIIMGIGLKADIQSRMNAIDKWMDRKKGRPAQSMEVSRKIDILDLIEEAGRQEKSATQLIDVTPVQIG
jgi:hypothetical protein